MAETRPQPVALSSVATIFGVGAVASAFVGGRGTPAPRKAPVAQAIDSVPGSSPAQGTSPSTICATAAAGLAAAAALSSRRARKAEAASASWGSSASSKSSSTGGVAMQAAGKKAEYKLRMDEELERYLQLTRDEYKSVTGGKFVGGLVGAEAGFGRYEFDPLDLHIRYPDLMPWAREAELKHGRVCMLATLGLIAPDFVRLPVEQLEDPKLDNLNAHAELIGPGLGEGPMWWMLLVVGIIESLRFRQLGLGFEKLTLENAGDLDFGKGFLPMTEEGILQMKVKELKNGRLAMLAFSGAIVQMVVFKAPHFPYVPQAAASDDRVPADACMWGSTASQSSGSRGGVAMQAAGKKAEYKLRMDEELEQYLQLTRDEYKSVTGGKFVGGVVGAEAGFGRYEFDPLDFHIRYPELMPWAREAELKHGRICMLATLGLIAPDFVRFPVDVFEDPTLDNLNAHAKLIGPGLGEGPMWGLLIVVGILESLRFRQLGLGFEKLTLENAGDCDFGKGFLPKTEEGILQMKVKELKNGRLAMLAFSGAIGQMVAFNAPHFPYVPQAAASDADVPSDARIWGSTATKSFASRGVVSMQAANKKASYKLRMDEELDEYLRLTRAEYTPITGGKFVGGIVGAEAGFGRYEFDPLDFHVRYPDLMPWAREAELKHGRICMLACLGLVAPDFVRFPVEMFEDPKLDNLNAHAALIGPGLGEGPMWGLLIVVGIIESLRFRQLGLGFEKLTLETAGDLDFGKGFLPKTEEGVLQMKVKELKNGRLAMLAFSGAVGQMVAFNAPHFPFVPQATFSDERVASDACMWGATASQSSKSRGGVVMQAARQKAEYKLRMDEELEQYLQLTRDEYKSVTGGKFVGGIVGAEAGFGRYEFDPLDFHIRFPDLMPWAREAELKHGRVCMLATLGLVAPDFVRFPVEVFEDPDLDMINAHSKLIGPGLGEGPMWGLLIVVGILESLRFRQLGLGFERLTLENAGDCDFGKGFLPQTDEGVLQMKVKELKNGRLAMLAFSGAYGQAFLLNAHHFPFTP